MYSEAEKSVENIKKLVANLVKSSMPSGTYFGTVTSESPLNILVEQKILLTDKQLILSRNVTDFETEISFDDPLIAQEAEFKKITIKGMTREKGGERERDFEQSAAVIKGEYYNTKKVKHSVTVYNALKTGDKVALQRIQGGQKYLVTDRVVML